MKLKKLNRIFALMVIYLLLFFPIAIAPNGEDGSADGGSSEVHRLHSKFHRMFCVENENGVLGWEPNATQKRK